MKKKTLTGLKSHLVFFYSSLLEVTHSCMKCYFDEKTCRQKVFKSATSATPSARDLITGGEIHPRLTAVHPAVTS